MGIAPLVAPTRRPLHWRFLPSLPPAGSVFDGGTTGPIGLTVELYLGTLGWTDISPFVLYRDSSQLVTITRGRPDETSQVQPSTCTMQINNRDGRFSPRNPVGPYYGQIGRNTPIRVSRMQNGVRRYRFYGEVPAWPTTWDISGNDVWAPITAAGILRRLNQGTPPAFSVLRHGIPTDPSMVAYWPCEDGSSAISLASGLAGGTAMAVSGTLNPAAFSGFFSSSPIPTFKTDTWTGTVPAYTDVGSGRVSFIIYAPAATLTDATRIISIATGGSVSRIDVLYRTGGHLQMKVYDTTGAVVEDTGTPADFGGIDNGFTRITVNWDPHVGGGTSLSFGEYVLGQLGAINLGTYTLTQTVSGVQTVILSPDGTLTGASLGHVWVQAVSTEKLDVLSWLPAYSGEAPTDRFQRLCGEQGVGGVLVNPGEIGTDTVSMGYQLPDTFPNLMQQCADTDLSLLFEPRDQLALALRTRLSLYNQAARLALDYAQNQLSGPLDPVDDDLFTRNDVTVQRVGGSSNRQELTSGTLSTQAPPAGVGDYATSVSISLGSDGQLPDQAGWRLHLGTVDEPRYPHLSLNLRSTEITSNLDLWNACLTVDVGDRVTVANPPAWMPPDQITQIVQGYSESLGVFEHDMVLNLSPEDPYHVGVVGDAVLSRADTDGSTLAAPLGPILNPNGFFAGGSSSGWVTNSCSLTVVGTSGAATALPAGGPTGYGALVTANGGSSVSITERATLADLFPVIGSQAYNISLLVYYPSAAHTVEIGINWRDATNTLISTGTSFTAVSAGTWTALSGLFTAPSNAVYGAAIAGLGGTPANGDTVYFAGIVAWQGAVSVASTNTLLPLWTTSAGAFPFDIAVSPQGVGGERMTVTTISGGSSPQSFTVARAVNGVGVAWPAGTDVRLWQPTYVSL
jgi:hypothetical protein